MPYTKLPFTRNNPGCILFLLDQSGSMSSPFGREPSVSKARGVSDAVNRLLQTVATRCTKEDGVRDYFEVGVLGYGGHTRPGGSLLQGTWATGDLVPISVLNANPLRMDSRTRAAAGDMPAREVRVPIWVEPVSSGGTPMNPALRQAHNVLQTWIQHHQDSFPPILLHITDGAGDGDPRAAARDITNLSTNDGNVLLFNCHISDRPSRVALFPDSASGLSDPYAQTLFDISSRLPAPFLAEARAGNQQVTDQARGFAFNADLVELIQFLDIGTRVSRILR